ncbi:MAG TPA: prolipoprotein diacylglyceryl transferase [Gemmatimonadaceae bacterium]|jgi:phosphatidylglycerol:prolipoprotein diacylglycerol transferase
MPLASPIVHHPTTFDLGPIALTGFGVAVLFAFLIAQIVSERELTRRGHEREAAAVSDIIFAAVLGTMLGGKLYYVLVVTHRVSDLWSRSGFVFWGGFIGSVLLCWLTIRRKKLSFLRFADVAGIAIAAGYAVGRTGCWAIGDDYGKPYQGFLAVAFPNGSPPSTAVSMFENFHVAIPSGVDPNSVLTVYPTQLMEVVFGFAMFLILWRLRKHTHAEGWLFGVWCVLAGAERFVVEFFRAKDDRFGWALGLSTAQLIAVAIVVTGIGIMLWRSRTKPSRRGVATAASVGLILASACVPSRPANAIASSSTRSQRRVHQVSVRTQRAV